MTYSETEKEILEEFDKYRGYIDISVQNELENLLKASLKKMSMATAESLRVEDQQGDGQYDNGFSQAVSEMQEKERGFYE